MMKKPRRSEMRQRENTVPSFTCHVNYIYFAQFLPCTCSSVNKPTRVFQVVKCFNLDARSQSIDSSYRSQLFTRNASRFCRTCPHTCGYSFYSHNCDPRFSFENTLSLIPRRPVRHEHAMLMSAHIPMPYR